MHELNYLFLHYTGSDNGSGAWYLWWSGFVGDLAIGGAVVTFYRHRNCHAHRCWRLGKHAVDGTPYVTCKRHHPAAPAKITADHIAAAHAEAQASSS